MPVTRHRPTRMVSLLAICVLAGCGDLPQPYRHHGAVSPLARPVGVRAVEVRPVDDSAPAKAMAEALVRALLASDVPAAVGGDQPGAWDLRGTARPQGERVALAWVLGGPGHGPDATFSQWLPAEAWRGAAAHDLDPVARRAVAALMKGEAAAPAMPHRPTARLVLPPDLPGDGAAALARAMRNALEMRGILVVTANPDYVVTGKATVADGPPGQQSLAVSWTLSRADGTRIGTIGQKGLVPEGRLTQPWGELARDIAQGGAQGILQAVKAADRASPAP